MRITTDDGLVGWGECFAYGATLAVCNVVDDALAPLLIGQDPTQIELHTDRMHRALMIWGRRGLAMMAVSGVELALWDIAGKARGVPVYQLLGGLCQSSVRAYASLLRYDSTAHLRQAVTTALKRRLHGGQAPPDRRGLGGRRPRGGGPAGRHHARHQLSVDGGGCDPHRPQARALRPALAGGAGVAARGLRRSGARPARRCACRSPAARTRPRRSRSARSSRPARADIVQPSMTKVGGIGEMKKIAVAGRKPPNVTFVPHSVLLRARAGGDPPRRRLDPGRAVRGDATGPAQRAPAGRRRSASPTVRSTCRERPGLGADPDPDVFRRHAYTREAARPFYLHVKRPLA